MSDGIDIDEQVSDIRKAVIALNKRLDAVCSLVERHQEALKLMSDLIMMYNFKGDPVLEKKKISELLRDFFTKRGSNGKGN